MRTQLLWVVWALFLAGCQSPEYSAGRPSPKKYVPPLDLIDGPAFWCSPTSIKTVGVLSQETTWETFFPDMLLSGLEPNRYDYFLFRRPANPSVHVFDIVFFSRNGRAYALGIRPKFIVESSKARAVVSFTLEGGGEAGHLETRRTFSFIADASEPRRALNILLEETDTTSSIWSGRHVETGRTTLHFRAAEIAEALLLSARKLPLGETR